MAEEKASKPGIIKVEGIVTEVLPGLEYKVDVEFQGLKHSMVCYVSGKMRTNYIQLDKGDKVTVEISVHDIDKGRIVYRLTSKRAENKATV